MSTLDLIYCSVSISRGSEGSKSTTCRAVATSLIGGGGGAGVYVRIFAFCPTSFFSNQIQIDQFENQLVGQKRNIQIYTLPPLINILATALTKLCSPQNTEPPYILVSIAEEKRENFSAPFLTFNPLYNPLFTL